MATQKQIVREKLLKGEYITSDDMQEIGGDVKAKSSRDVIYNLRKDLKKIGLDITDIWIKSATGKRYKKFFMTTEHIKQYNEIKELSA